MKLEVHLDYENEVITDCDIAKAICELCGRQSNTVNPRKIAQIILLEFKNYEQMWEDLHRYIKRSRTIDSETLLGIMNCMEGKYE